MNVKIFYGGSSGFRKILPSSTNYMPIVDLAILDDSRNRKVKVDVQGNRVEEEEEILHFDDVVAFSDDYPSLTEGTIEALQILCCGTISTTCICKTRRIALPDTSKSSRV